MKVSRKPQKRPSVYIPRGAERVNLNSEEFTNVYMNICRLFPESVTNRGGVLMPDGKPFFHPVFGICESHGGLHA